MDTIDNETYASENSDYFYRTQLHEKWYNYTMNELIPTIKSMNAACCNNYEEKLMVFGASMGGMHAANFFFRRPDIFDSVLAMSGLYEPSPYFPKTYMDDILYNNSPTIFLKNMPLDHYSISKYNEFKIFIVSGLGAWEDIAINSTNNLPHVLEEKAIRTNVEFWGMTGRGGTSSVNTTFRALFTKMR